MYKEVFLALEHAQLPEGLKITSYYRLARWDQPPSSHPDSQGRVTACSWWYVKVYPSTCELQEPTKVLLMAHHQHGSKQQVDLYQLQEARRQTTKSVCHLHYKGKEWGTGYGTRQS